MFDTSIIVPLVLGFCLGLIFGYLATRIVNAFREVRSLERDCQHLANGTTGTHEDALITREAEGAISLANLLVKTGTDPATQVATGGANDEPLGVCNTEAEDEETVGLVALCGGMQGTITMIASAAIAAGSRVYTAANGKTSTLSETAGDYYLVGKAMTAATADGDEYEVAPCFPVKTTVEEAAG